jgi:hypothetical protein
MAAVELLETFPLEVAGVPLRLVGAAEAWRVRQGPSLAQRRNARANARTRRNRLALGAVVAVAIAVLSMPGHVFGATGAAGVSSDVAGGSTLAAGMNYVVQPGDTVASIAREINPADPSLARTLLVRELGSAVVVPGEHVLVP